jgi:DNA invertase Pin-like site-specific DNA recombinase
MNVVCYSRVSSASQDLDLQTSELKKFCDYRNYKIIKMYSDKLSGKNMDRPGFQEMINFLDKNTMDVNAVVIWKLDRIGRSLSDLLKIVEYLKSKKLQLITVNDNIDTSSAQGILFFQIACAFGEYERKLINERTSAGKDAAIAAGVKFGRPKVDIDMDQIRKEIAMGLSKSLICKKYGFKRSTLYTKLNETKEDVKI